MEVAKVTSKGQITIPISIRRKLDINEGDKVLFIYKPDGVLMVNPVTFQGSQIDEDVDAAETGMAAEPVAAKKKSAAKASPPAAKAKPSPDKVVAEQAIADEPVEASAPEPEPVSRPVPPPVEEPEKPEKNIGGLNLSTLLDDIRSIGSNY